MMSTSLIGEIKVGNSDRDIDEHLKENVERNFKPALVGLDMESVLSNICCDIVEVIVVIFYFICRYEMILR